MGSAVGVPVALTVVVILLAVAVTMIAGGFIAAVFVGVTCTVVGAEAEAVAAGCAIVSRLLYVLSTSSPGMDEKLKMMMAKKSAGHQRSQARRRLEQDDIVILY